MTRSIRAKMILFIGLPAMAVFLTVMLWLLGFAQRQARRVHLAEMAENAATVAGQFDEYIGKAAQVAEMTARFIKSVPNLQDLQIYEILEGNVRLNRRIYGAAMAFEPGAYKEGHSLFCPYVYEDRDSGRPLKMNIDESVYDWYRDERWQWWHLPKQRGEAVWTDPYFDEGAGNILMTTYAVPFQRNGEFGGVTTVDMNLERLREDVATAIPKIGNFVILNSDGHFIYSPNREEILSKTIFEVVEKGGRTGLDEVIRKMLGGESGEVATEGLFGKERMLYAYASIPSTGWTFVGFHSEEAAMAEFHEQRALVIGAFFAAGLVMLMTIIFMSGKVARPIRRLREKAQRIAEGDSGVEIAGIGSSDEIGELAKAFANMQEKVHDREVRLEQARETTLAELLESAPDAMVVADRKGRICRMNGKVEKIFGVGRAELTGEQIQRLLPEQAGSELVGRLSSFLDDPRTVEAGTSMELQGFRSDGSRFPAEIGVAPFHEPEGVMSVIVIRDITERKQTQIELEQAREQAEAANHAKSDFLSSMSHELRTPLNGVLGYAQILQRDKSVTPKQRENIESIISCGDHLLSLINDVLDLSKIEAGRLDLDEGPCDLDKLTKSLTDIIRQKARSKNLEFSVEVSPEVPRGILTDGAKLRQILVNLLGNAVKFTSEGSVTLRLSEDSDGELAFDVIDTGIGMEPHELEEIFDPFKQVGAGKAAGGTGLGLAISRKLVEKMGGRIELESAKGKGSRFRVTLPLREADEEELTARKEGESTDHAHSVLAPGQSFHILVADDRETNRDILEQMLAEIGFEVSLADDGDTALEMLEKETIDLVLMDVRMPRLNGIAALKRIRANPALADLPVFAVTASVFPEFREKALASGFDDFLPKPFRASELIRKLKQHLDAAWETEAAETASAEMDEDSPETTGDLSLSAELLERFRAALKIKNLTALNALARELCQNATTSVAGQEMTRLARSFDFNGLAKLEKRLSGNG